MLEDAVSLAKRLPTPGPRAVRSITSPGPVVGPRWGAIVRVAFLGPEHSFTHMAAEGLFPGAEYIACRSITEVFRAVEGYEADYGVVPVENSLEGPVGETLDNLASTMLHVYAALEARISLVLAGRRGAPRLYGHPHALREAARSLDRLAPGVERVAVSSTSRPWAAAPRRRGRCASAATGQRRPTAWRCSPRASRTAPTTPGS